MKKIITSIFVLGASLVAYPAYAHCPLCTIGAGGAALVAKWLGISAGPIGIFLGAFAVALGLWTNTLIRKTYFPGQRLVLSVGSFLLTIFPLRYLFTDYSSIFISWSGDYGTLLNRTYLIDLFLVGAVIGGLIMFGSPWVSKKLTSLRNKVFAYQGIVITFSMLLIVSLILELWF